MSLFLPKSIEHALGMCKISSTSTVVIVRSAVYNIDLSF